MHCPRCGQEQASAETKFCSRCGFQLALVAELLANGGFLPQLVELYQGKSSWFTRKNGVILGILWFISFVMMIPAFFGIADFEQGAAISAVFGLFSSVMILIVSLAFLKKGPKANYLRTNEISPPVGLHGNQGQAALPPGQGQPAADYFAPQGSWKTPDTGELVTPGTVTEGTTKLLSKEEEK